MWGAQVAVEVPPEVPPELPPMGGAAVCVRVGEGRGGTYTWVGAGAGLVRVGDGVGDGVVGVGASVVGGGVVGVGDGVGDAVVGVALTVVAAASALTGGEGFELFPSTAPPITPATTITLRPAIPTCSPRFTVQSCGLHPDRPAGTGRPHLDPP